LHLRTVARPMTTLGLTPSGLDLLVDMRDLCPRADRTGPHFWWLGKRLPNDCRCLPIVGKRSAQCSPSLGGNHFASRPELRNFATRRIERGKPNFAIHDLTEQNFLFRLPPNSTSRRLHLGRNIPGCAPPGRNNKYVTTRRAFIAHDSTDESDIVSVRRPPRHCNLKRWFVNRPNFAAFRG